MKKIVTILVAIALIAIIGTATADQVNVYEPSTTTLVTDIPLMPGGAAVEKDLVISAFLQGAGTGHNLTHTIAVTTNPGGATINDIVIEYKELSPLGAWGVQTYAWTQESVAGPATSEKLGIRFSAIGAAPVGATYDIEIKDLATGNSFKARLIVSASSIPEFPTIALPIAAILGLAFIFQRRREEE